MRMFLLFSLVGQDPVWALAAIHPVWSNPRVAAGTLGMSLIPGCILKGVRFAGGTVNASGGVWKTRNLGK